MRTDTVTFCGGWNILAHFDERSNSEKEISYRGSTRINADWRFGDADDTLPQGNTDGAARLRAQRLPEDGF
jgi:hypothetical protein